mmetsp:Transcript_96362/g.297148  ORF Transcript_96362/g.297148 Transcript_96362/m.297148 type:complete len:240 (+) Transcript_96362:113-832(+)
MPPISVLCSQHLGLGSRNLGLDLGAALLQRELHSTHVFGAVGTGDIVALVLVGDVLLLRGLPRRVLADLLVGLGVHVLNLVGVDARLNVLREVGLILGGIFLCHHLHVLLHVIPEDLLLVRLRIVLGVRTLLLRRLVAREVFGAVGDVQAAVSSTLERTPHAATNNSAPEADIEDALEGALLVLLVLDVIVLAVDLLLALELLVEPEPLQHAARGEKARAVGRGVVLVAHGDPEAAELP